MEFQKLVCDIEKEFFNEIFASIQYKIDSRNFSGDKKMKKELLKHSNEEYKHAMLLCELLHHFPSFINYKRKSLNYQDNDEEIIKRNLNDEIDAINTYTLLLDKFPKESGVYKTIESILKDEIEHKNDFVEFLKSGLHKK